MGPFWLLLIGMLFVWLLSNGVLTKLMLALTGPGQTPGGNPPGGVNNPFQGSF